MLLTIVEDGGYGFRRFTRKAKNVRQSRKRENEIGLKPLNTRTNDSLFLSSASPAKRLIILHRARMLWKVWLSSKSNKRREKARKTRETAETIYDALETLMLGNPIDENSL